MTNKSATTKNQLLDAASEVVRKSGYQGLTLDAVAIEAGVSKGGLLYHYPSKEALVAALISRQIERFESRLERVLSKEEALPGRWTLAYIQASLVPDELGQTSADFGLIAAVAMNPELLTPLRNKYAQWQRALLADGIPKEAAQTLRFAVDGIWLCSLLGLGAPTIAETKRMVKWMRETIGAYV